MIERRDVILKYIQSKGDVTTEELFELFPNRTPMTIRRDLSYLEQSGLILRSHGSARINTAMKDQLEQVYNVREIENTQIKHGLAAAAIGFVEDSRSLFIDAGTTMMAFAQRLPDSSLTILTSAPNIAMRIASQNPSCSVMLTGGSLNPKTLSCSGYGSAEILKLLNIDTAFMAASGYAHGSGFTVGEHFECELKRMVLTKAARVILLMDSSKVGKSMPYTFAQPQDIDILICDDGLDSRTEDAFKSKGVTVLKFSL